MSEKLGQEPALPCTHKHLNSHGIWDIDSYPGMSKREYAAIKLRIPDSGEEWLDEMIRKANRRDAANAAMQGMISNVGSYGTDTDKELVSLSYRFADELLKQESNE